MIATARIGQLLSNLLGNAIAHGASGKPVRVTAVTGGGALVLAVANGAAIPDAVIGNLFKPFVRANTRSNRDGLGFGLYIASDIAKAHGGTLDDVSDDEETRFTFTMPLASDAI